MKAVVYVGEGRVEVADVPAPALKEPDDALVRVTSSSICGSDLHVLTGKTPGMEPGRIIGHEFVGTVVEVGPDCLSTAVGERVVGSFLIACGACDRCVTRAFNHCRTRRALGLGSLMGDLDGAQAELVRVPHADVNLHPLGAGAETLDDERALFTGDVLATALYAVGRGDIAAGDRVAVVGGGPIGLMCAVAARRAGGQVVVADHDAQRVAFARSAFGLDAIDASAGDPRSAVAAATGGELADAVFEAVGSVAALKTSLGCVRPGGRVVVVGVYGKERYELALGRAWASAIDLRFCGLANVQGHWEDGLDAVARGELDPAALVTHRFALDDAEAAYEAFAGRRAVKVVLTTTTPDAPGAAPLGDPP